MIGDAASCGLTKAGHVANSACYSPFTDSTASWLTAVYLYDPTERRMKVASNGAQTFMAGLPTKPTEAATIERKRFKAMNTWFNTLMGDTTG